MDSSLVKEIEEFDDVDLETDNEENLSPKAKAEKEFEQEIPRYNDNTVGPEALITRRIHQIQKNTHAAPIFGHVLINLCI